MPNSLAKMVGFGVAVSAAAAIAGDTAVGLTALGSTQGTALAFSANYTMFTTVAAGTGAILPTIANVPGLGVVQGDDFIVFNNGANALIVYPPVGSQIALGATNAGQSIPSGKSCFFIMLSNTVWGYNLSA